MLVTLGHRRAAADLLGALLECHARIRSFSALAVKVADRPDLPAAETAETCARVARYFAEALPLHVQDEEASIQPRLQGRSRVLDDVLAEMHAQHQAHEAPLRRLVALCALLPTTADVAVRSTFREVAYALDEQLQQHLRHEETLLFPAFPAELSAAEEHAIMAELRARRQPR